MMTLTEFLIGLRPSVLRVIRADIRGYDNFATALTQIDDILGDDAGRIIQRSAPPRQPDDVGNGG